MRGPQDSCEVGRGRDEGDQVALALAAPETRRRGHGRLQWAGRTPSRPVAVGQQPYGQRREREGLATSDVSPLQLLRNATLIARALTSTSDCPTAAPTKAERCCWRRRPAPWQDQMPTTSWSRRRFVPQHTIGERDRARSGHPPRSAWKLPGNLFKPEVVPVPRCIHAVERRWGRVRTLSLDWQKEDVRQRLSGHCRRRGWGWGAARPCGVSVSRTAGSGPPGDC